MENPFLLEKYSEEIGQLIFNEEKYTDCISSMIEFSSLNAKNKLENSNLRSYLEDKGFIKMINYLYNPSLVNTYSAMINNTQNIVEKNFLELLSVHKNLLNKNELSEAYKDFEQNMDDESFKKFLKIKSESLKD